MRELCRRFPLLVGVVLSALIGACAWSTSMTAERHRWESGLGPVLPHDTFPEDCSLCHVGPSWNTLVEGFTFDHERETGVALEGAHDQAHCLRCHNDRGPVDLFQARGCAGCHEDVHQGDLGPDCTSCHDQRTWLPSGQFALHYHTRFPLTGAHAGVSCRRCHPGLEAGNFVPTDPECVTCHQADLLSTTNHVGLGWVDRCHRCHMPTAWEQAEID